MNKTHSLLLIAAFALAACSSKQADNATLASTNGAETPQITDANVAETVFKQHFPEITNFWNQNNQLSYSGSYEEESEGCDMGEELACYPLADGGYLVAFGHNVSGPGCATEYYYWTEQYKDGVLDTATIIKLPEPALEDLLNPSKTGDYQAEIAEFKEMYDESPLSFVYITFNPPTGLSIVLHPYDCDETYPGMAESMRHLNESPLEYAWNGKEFVKQ
ncbi:MAG: hypothetical protein J6Y82_01305 [Bacteroidales bacterium]|nr:hypothetical protein [Bacteroidales bacterium]